MQTKGGGSITSFMDEPSNEGASGFTLLIRDVVELEIYGFPIGIVLLVLSVFGLFFGFVWLMEEKFGIDVLGGDDHSVGGDGGGDGGS